MKQRDGKDLKYLNDAKAFIVYSTHMDEIYKNIVRGRQLNISLVFITQSYFAVPKNIRLNSTQYFIMKIPNKRELANCI